MGVRRAMALIGDARQASSEGKSGLVDTGLTGTAATALCLHVQLHSCYIGHFHKIDDSSS